jgi:hypothetical protein
MNPAVTTLRKIRGERLPEDSGEWRSARPKFKSLSNRTPMLHGTGRAQILMATLLAWAFHAGVLHAAVAYVESPLLLLCPGSMAGTVVGLIWLAQFKELRQQRAVYLGFIWSAAVVIPGWMWALALCFQNSIALGACAAIGVVFFAAVWCGLGVVSALVVHALVGGRP